MGHLRTNKSTGEQSLVLTMGDRRLHDERQRAKLGVSCRFGLPEPRRRTFDVTHRKHVIEHLYRVHNGLQTAREIVEDNQRTVDMLRRRAQATLKFHHTRIWTPGVSATGNVHYVRALLQDAEERLRQYRWILKGIKNNG